MSRDIPISLIDRDPDQPRQHFDQAALSELAQSIAANGLAVPILVRPAGERFIIVHGERRYRAVQSLGSATIAAEVRDVAPDAARWLALVENVQRADLSPIEEARAYQARLAEGITQAQLGERIGKSQSYIATKLRFLNLPEEVQEGLDRRLITEGHAKQLLRLDDPKGMSALYKDIIALKSPVRVVAEIVDDYWKMRDAEREIFRSLHDIAIALKEVYDRFGAANWSWWVHDYIIPDGVIPTEDMAIALMSTAKQPAPTSRYDAPEVYFDMIDATLGSMSRDIAPSA